MGGLDLPISKVSANLLSNPLYVLASATLYHVDSTV